MNRRGWIGSSLLLLMVVAVGVGLGAWKYGSIRTKPLRQRTSRSRWKS